MMKLRGWGVLVISVFFLTSNVFAAEKALMSSEEPVIDKKPAKVVQAPKIDEKAVKKIREKIEEKKKEINGSEWGVDLGSRDPKAKGGADVLTFQDGMVKLAGFHKQGYGPTNYTISVPSEDSELAIFETMQVSKDAGMIFIRGEWNKDKMQGIINEQTDGGKSSREWWFTSSGKASVSPTSEKKEEAIAAQSVEAASTLSSKEDGSKIAVPSKNKGDKNEKGWF